MFLLVAHAKGSYELYYNLSATLKYAAKNSARTEVIHRL